MAARSKTKGAAFERQVCKDLSLWLSLGQREDLLWRSAMSGGRATLARSRGHKMKSSDGDLSPIDVKGQALTEEFFVELKHYNILRWDSLVLKRSGTVQNIWNQCVKEADQSDKYPLLVAKQNFMPIKLVTDARGWLRLFYPQQLDFLESYYAPTPESRELFIADYDYFLRNSDPDILQESYTVPEEEIVNVMASVFWRSLYG